MAISACHFSISREMASYQLLDNPTSEGQYFSPLAIKSVTALGQHGATQFVIKTVISKVEGRRLIEQQGPRQCASERNNSAREMLFRSQFFLRQLKQTMGTMLICYGLLIHLGPQPELGWYYTRNNCTATCKILPSLLVGQ